MRSAVPDRRPRSSEICLHEAAELKDYYSYYWPINIDRHLQRLNELAVWNRAAVDVESRWTTYLASLPQRNLASEEVAMSAEDLWFNLVETLPGLTPPDASPTTDDGLLMSWDKNGRHLEIEVFPSGSYEWFYRERAVDVTESGEEGSVEAISETLLGRIRHLLV